MRCSWMAMRSVVSRLTQYSMWNSVYATYPKHPFGSPRRPIVPTDSFTHVSEEFL